MFKQLLSAALGCALAVGVLLVVPSAAGTASAAACQSSNSTITNYQYVIKHLDGTTVIVNDLKNNVKAGDHITASFTIVNCQDVTVSLAAYRAPTDIWNEVRASEQTLFDSATGQFDTGRHVNALEVTVPAKPGTPSGDCPNTKLSEANFTGNGANVSGPYDTICDGSPSLNGNTENSNAKQPCAGCVGAADNKNPQGQLPNAANDGNKGYECDKNQGVGQSNPAHSGCTTNKWFQVDLVRGDVLKTLGPIGSNNYYYKDGNRLLDTNYA